MSSTKQKKVVANAEPRYNPFHRYKWFSYVEDDADDDEVAVRVKVRTNLTFGELEMLTWAASTSTAMSMASRT